jgi:hypothetical protein
MNTIICDEIVECFNNVGINVIGAGNEDTYYLKIVILVLY